jgi:hypothetical protein
MRDGLPPFDRGSRRRLSASGFTTIAVAFELFLIPAGWFIAWAWPGPPVPAAEWNLPDARRGALLTAPLLVILALITWTPLKRLRPLRRIRILFRRRFGATLAGLGAWQILLIAATAGIAEEVLFRGALQPRMGLPATSVFFGLLHWITPTYFVFAALMGLYLGWAFEAYGSLFVPMVVHALYDAAALLVVRGELRRHGCHLREVERE